MKPKFMQSIRNIEDFIIEHNEIGPINPKEFLNKIRTELSTLSKEDLFKLSETIIFKNLAEQFFTEETIKKMYES